MQDFSFIRLNRTFSQAIDMDESNAVINLGYYKQIQLIPTNQHYSFITNVKGGIVFNDNYKVEIIDINEEILSDVTSNFYIEEFISDIDGSNQIKCEFENLNVDYYRQSVFFKLTHTVGTDIFYSNPLTITNYEAYKCVRFDFKNNANLDGTCYNIAQIYQSISLRCWFDKKNYTSKSSEYTTLAGDKVTSRVIKTSLREYVFDEVNNFLFDRLNYLLTHDIIYIDGIRVTNKQTIESEDRLDFTTNIAKQKLKVPVNYNDIYNFPYQIIIPLQVTTRYPVHQTKYLLAGFNPIFTLIFNQNINVTPTIISLYKDGVLVNTRIPTYLNNILTIDFSSYIFENGLYNLLVLPDVIYHESGFFAGYIFGQWSFTIATTIGDFNSSDFNNLDFNT